MPKEWATRLLAENGPIETPSAIGYFVAAVMLWFFLDSKRWYSRAAAVVVLIAGGMRELDFQTRFTSSYAISSGFFLRGSTPVEEKILVGAVLLLIAGAALTVVVLNWRAFLEDLRSLQIWALSTGFAIAFMFVSTGLDEIGGFLRRNYAATSLDLQFTLWVFEETLEASIPFLFAFAVIEAARAIRPHSEVRDTLPPKAA
jgi:hypothetical protein